MASLLFLLFASVSATTVMVGSNEGPRDILSVFDDSNILSFGDSQNFDFDLPTVLAQLSGLNHDKNVHSVQRDIFSIPSTTVLFTLPPVIHPLHKTPTFQIKLSRTFPCFNHASTFAQSNNVFIITMSESRKHNLCSHCQSMVAKQEESLSDFLNRVIDHLKSVQVPPNFIIVDLEDQDIASFTTTARSSIHKLTILMQSLSSSVSIQTLHKNSCSSSISQSTQEFINDISLSEVTSLPTNIEMSEIDAAEICQDTELYKTAQKNGLWVLCKTAKPTRFLLTSQLKANQSDSSEYTVNEIAQYQIVLWTSLFLSILVIIVAYTTGCMNLTRDSLLYSKFKVVGDTARHRD